MNIFINFSYFFFYVKIFVFTGPKKLLFFYVSIHGLMLLEIRMRMERKEKRFSMKRFGSNSTFFFPSLNTIRSFVKLSIFILSLLMTLAQKKRAKLKDSERS